MGKNCQRKKRKDKVGATNTRERKGRTGKGAELAKERKETATGRDRRTREKQENCWVDECRDQGEAKIKKNSHESAWRSQKRFERQLIIPQRTKLKIWSDLGKNCQGRIWL